MRRITPYALLLPLALAAAACTSPDQDVSLEEPAATASPQEDEPDTTGEQSEEDAAVGGELEFGESAAFPHPVGAYEEEFEDGVEEDVVYTVDDVTADGAGSVDFTLTVEVPDLQRVFGLGNMTVECVYDGIVHPATSEDPVVEAEAGTHAMEMFCEDPGESEQLTVVMLNDEDEAAWTGPLG